MSSKLRKEDSQPIINQFFTTAEVHSQSIVRKGDSKCMTPKESKCKRSPPSDAKPVKKLNLELDKAEQLEHFTARHISEIMANNEGNPPVNSAPESDPIDAN